MFRKTLLPALALSAVALAGCGSGASTAPGAGAPASSAAAPASSAATPASSAAAPTPAADTPAASPSAGGGAAEVADPCEVLDAGKIKDLTGVEVKKGAAQDLGGSKICSWYPQDATTSDAAVFSGQEGPLKGSLSQVEGSLKSQFGGKVSKLSVDGADDGRYLTGKKSGLNVIDVIAQKDDVFYQVLVASPRDAAQHKDGAVKIAEALLKA